MPQPIVAFDCGSRSISSTRRCVAASDAARLTQVVVLPTPPFWFATQITLPMRYRRAAALRIDPLQQHDRAPQFRPVRAATGCRRKSGASPRNASCK